VELASLWPAAIGNLRDIWAPITLQTLGFVIEMSSWWHLNDFFRKI